MRWNSLTASTILNGSVIPFGVMTGTRPVAARARSGFGGGPLAPAGRRRCANARVLLRSPVAAHARPERRRLRRVNDMINGLPHRRRLVGPAPDSRQV